MLDSLTELKNCGRDFDWEKNFGKDYDDHRSEIRLDQVKSNLVLSITSIEISLKHTIDWEICKSMCCESLNLRICRFSQRYEKSKPTILNNLILKISVSSKHANLFSKS